MLHSRRLLGDFVNQFLARYLVILQLIQALLDLSQTLSDIERVGRDGILFAHQIRRLLDKADVPVVILGNGREWWATGDEFE